MQLWVRWKKTHRHRIRAQQNIHFCSHDCLLTSTPFKLCFVCGFLELVKRHLRTNITMHIQKIHTHAPMSKKYLVLNMTNTHTRWTHARHTQILFPLLYAVIGGLLAATPQLTPSQNNNNPHIYSHVHTHMRTYKSKSPYAHTSLYPLTLCRQLLHWRVTGRYSTTLPFSIWQTLHDCQRICDRPEWERKKELNECHHKRMRCLKKCTVKYILHHLTAQIEALNLYVHINIYALVGSLKATAFVRACVSVCVLSLSSSPHVAIVLRLWVCVSVSGSAHTRYRESNFTGFPARASMARRANRSSVSPNVVMCTKRILCCAPY